MISHTGEGQFPENPRLSKINEFLDAGLRRHDEMDK
jgi:hypothetical protein